MNIQVKGVGSVKNRVLINKVGHIRPPISLPNFYSYTAPELYLEYLENPLRVLKPKLVQHYTLPSKSSESPSLKRAFSVDDQYRDDATDEKKQKLEHAVPDVYNERLKELEKDVVGQVQPEIVFPPPPPLYRQKQSGPDEDIEIIKQKQTVLAKLALLGRMYPKMPIPFISMANDLVYMETEYKNIFKKQKLQDKTENYKRFMYLAFFGIEYLLGKVFKLQMEGYAAEQISNIENYERLLIELGEKHFMPDAPEKFPVEVRLLGMMVIQTAMFLAGQFVFKKISSNTSNNMMGSIMGIIGNLFTSGKSAKDSTKISSVEQVGIAGPVDTNQEKPRMKGP
jgi:hypothetical protein